LFLLLFVSRCPPPRDLHSFPTRRSSDLDDGVPREESDLRRHRRRPQRRLATGDGVDLLGDLHRPRHGVEHFATPEPGTAEWQNRSEEHTSELQSRENLVCRLLLEKKNTK